MKFNTPLVANSPGALKPMKSPTTREIATPKRSPRNDNHMVIARFAQNAAVARSTTRSESTVHE